VPAEKPQFVSAIVSTSRRRLLRIFIAGILCLHLLFFINMRERIKRGYPDFTVFYTAAAMLREGLGQQLYDERAQYAVQNKSIGQIAERRAPLPYIHPPFEALIFLPLSWLPYPQAFALWDVVNLIALFGVALLLRRSVDALRLIPPWEFVIASLTFFPIFDCFLQGQDSILQLLLCVLGFNALKRDADVLAGCWFALGAFKFQFMIPIVLLLVTWKHRRVMIGFAAVSAVLVLISAGVAGWQSLLHYPEFALRITKSPGLGGVAAGFAPNLRGLAEGLLSSFSKQVGSVVALLTSVLLFFFAAATGRDALRTNKLELQFSLAVVVSGLVAWQTNMHDLSLLVLPLVLIADYCLRTSSENTRRKSSLLLPVLPVLISPLWIALWLVGGAANLMAIPLLWWVWEIGREVSSSVVVSLGVRTAIGSQ
jgi:glycosyl transferase family 87